MNTSNVTASTTTTEKIEIYDRVAAFLYVMSEARSKIIEDFTMVDATLEYLKSLQESRILLQEQNPLLNVVFLEYKTCSQLCLDNPDHHVCQILHVLETGGWSGTGQSMNWFIQKDEVDDDLVIANTYPDFDKPQPVKRGHLSQLLVENQSKICLDSRVEAIAIFNPERDFLPCDLIRFLQKAKN